MRSQNILFLLSVLLLFSWFVYIVIYLFSDIFKKYKKYRHQLFGIIFILVLPLPVGMLYGDSFWGGIFQIFYSIGAITLWALFLSFYILFPSFIISKIRKKNFWKIGQIIIAIICIIINLQALYAGFIPHIVNYTIAFEKDHHWHGKKIVLISDLHYGYMHGEYGAGLLVEKVNAIQPDLVLIPGDLFDGPSIEFQSIANIVNNIQAPVFFANGNHEEYRNTAEMMRAIEGTHFEILNDRTLSFSGVNISGVSYHNTRTSEQLHSVLQNIHPANNGNINILLKHVPTGHDIIQNFGYDLVVSGHTHRGQMWPFTWITDSMYGKYVYGLSQDNSLYSLTTSGVGNWWPPQRFLTRSEIVVIHIQ